MPSYPNAASPSTLTKKARMGQLGGVVHTRIAEECQPPSVAGSTPSTFQLARGAEKHRAHHGFNPGCHLLGGDTVRGLKPAARGSKNGPGSGGRQ